MIKKTSELATAVCRVPIKRIRLIYVLFGSIVVCCAMISTNSESLIYGTQKYSPKTICRAMLNYIENPKNETIVSKINSSCEYTNYTSTECLDGLNTFEVSDEFHCWFCIRIVIENKISVCFI